MGRVVLLKVFLMLWEQNTSTVTFNSPLSEMLWDLHNDLLTYVPDIPHTEDSEKLIAALLLATSNAYTRAAQTQLKNAYDWMRLCVLAQFKRHPPPLKAGQRPPSRLDDFLAIHDRAVKMKLLEVE